jgi:inhibitor of cysteine peptidase
MERIMSLNLIKYITFFFLASFSTVIFAEKSNPNPSAPIYNETKTSVILQGKERVFTIRLKSNPTTGYQWYLRDYSSKMIIPILQRYVPSEKKLIGSGGMEEWKFKVSDRAMTYPHQLILRMIYARPSQGAEGSTSVLFRISTHP